MTHTTGLDINGVNMCQIVKIGQGPDPTTGKSYLDGRHMLRIGDARHDAVGIDEALANARLWAASPDLLEASENLIAQIQKTHPGLGTSDLVYTLINAIDKAKGKKPSYDVLTHTQQRSQANGRDAQEGDMAIPRL